MARAIFYFLGAFATYACLVVIVNRLYQPQSGRLAVSDGRGLPKASEAITVATWNLGYAGLGAGSDFIADGGTHYLPPSRAAVFENLAGIEAEFARMDADVFLVQEAARASPLNYGVDVLDGLRKRFHGFATVFDPDVTTVLLPPPFRIAHGPAIYSRLEIGSAERRMLPVEDERYGGLVRRHYRMEIARLPVVDASHEWVVINIHLAAFDRDALVRRRQLQEVIAFAKGEFDKGNPIVIGGDWNLEFVRDTFPHTTEARHRFWLSDFPFEELPSGWTAVHDTGTPTVRTLHKPYRVGENYVTVIDGFVVSADVAVEWVRGTDMQFRYSDHQPVVTRLRHTSRAR